MTTNLTYRVGILEANYKDMDKKFDQILSNDLPHIRQSVIKLDGRITTLDEKITGKMDSLRTRIGILTMVNVGAIVLGLLLGKIL